MTTALESGQAPVLSVGGTVLSGEALDQLTSVTVDQAAGLPAVAVLRFSDPKQQVLQDAGLSVGALVSVSATALGGAALVPLFAGEVTALELEYDAQGTVVVARCADVLHRLTRNRRTRSWVQVTEAEVVTAVVAGAGLAIGALDASLVVHSHVAQLDSTDWDFLSARARDSGRELTVKDGLVCLQKRASTGLGTAIELEVGAQITRLRMRLTAAGQVPSVVVDGWNPTTGLPVTGRATSTGAAAAAGPGWQQVATAFTSLPLHGGTPVHATVAEAESRAQAIAAQVSDTWAEIEAESVGDPNLAPGATVHITGAGSSYDGTYALRRVRHVMDRWGYRSEIEAGGSEDRSLLGLTGSGDAVANGSGNRAMPGVTIGVVTDISDPLSEGRVKVMFPWLSLTYATDWIRVASAGAGVATGLVVLPEVHDEVLVAFAHGDTRQPYVLGGLWSTMAPPPQRADVVSGGIVQKRGVVSRGGHAMLVHDGLEQNGVELSTTGGLLSVRLSATDTTISVTSGGVVSIAGAGAVSVEAGGLLELVGKGGVEIRGTTISLLGAEEVALTAPLVKLN